MYYDIFKQYEQTQQAAALALFLIGLGWAAGWLLIDKIIPAPWLAAARWGYISLAALLLLTSVILLGGL